MRFGGRNLAGFLMLGLVLGAEGLNAEQPSIPLPALVAAGAPAPLPIAVAAHGEELDLVRAPNGRGRVEDLRLGVFVVGGPIQAVVVKGVSLSQGRSVPGQPGRLRFILPDLPARPGAMLRVVVSEAESGRAIAEAWLQVVEAFDSSALRLWCERHPLYIGPDLPGIRGAFAKWGIEVVDSGAEYAVIREGTAAVGVARIGGLLVTASAEGLGTVGRTDEKSEPGWLKVAIPPDVDLSVNTAARREFLKALHDLCTATGDGNDFPDP